MELFSLMCSARKLFNKCRAVFSLSFIVLKELDSLEQEVCDRMQSLILKSPDASSLKKGTWSVGWQITASETSVRSPGSSFSEVVLPNPHIKKIQINIDSMYFIISAANVTNKFWLKLRIEIKKTGNLKTSRFLVIISVFNLHGMTASPAVFEVCHSIPGTWLHFPLHDNVWYDTATLRFHLHSFS